MGKSRIDTSITGGKVTRLAVTSIVVAGLTLPTLFLMITIFIFPPVAFFIGVHAYGLSRRNPALPARVRALTAMAIVFSMAIFVLCIYIINTGYKA